MPPSIDPIPYVYNSARTRGCITNHKTATLSESRKRIEPKCVKGMDSHGGEHISSSEGYVKFPNNHARARINGSCNYIEF